MHFTNVSIIYWHVIDIERNLAKEDREYYGAAVRARGYRYDLKKFDRGAACTRKIHPWAWWRLLREFNLLLHPGRDRVPGDPVPYPDGTTQLLQQYSANVDGGEARPYTPCCETEGESDEELITPNHSPIPPSYEIHPLQRLLSTPEPNIDYGTTPAFLDAPDIPEGLEDGPLYEEAD